MIYEVQKPQLHISIGYGTDGKVLQLKATSAPAVVIVFMLGNFILKGTAHSKNENLYS